MTKKSPTTIKYKIDTNNNLIVNQQTKLNGSWSLTENHELSLKLNANKNGKSGDKIVVIGQIKDATKNSLLFEVSDTTDKTQIPANTIALIGTWQADAYNRLIFKVKKENSQHDILTFKNTWILNKNHRISYTFEKADLITKKKQTRELIFKGYWKITDNNRFYYELDQENDSGFDFKIGTAIFEKNRIKTKIMLGTNRREQTLRLSGEWNLNPDLGLSFGIDYGNNEIKHITFGADIDLSDQDNLSFKLNNGVTLKLSHKLLDGNSDAYIRYRQGLKEDMVDLGIGVRW